MELHHLRYFVAVAEELHFGRAARRLHMAQPPLSQQIRRLEGVVGARLFDRSRRHVALTPAGRAFLPHARRALQEAQLGADDARRAARGEIGRLAVGFVGSAMAGPLPAVVRAFRSRHPDVALTLRQMTTAAQVGALREGTLDVGCLRPPVVGDDLAVEVIATEPLLAAVPAGHPLAGPEALDLGELAEEAFIMSPREAGPGFFEGVTAACRAAGFQPRISQQSTEMTTILGLVASGMGVALVPSAMARIQMAGVALVPVRAPTPLPEAVLALAWRAGDTSPALGRFVEMAHAAGKD